jgi:uncharacterized protein YfbU (UPF0304 family)
MSPLTERFELRLDEDTIARVDRWRFARGGSRAEAIRQLVDAGLEAAAKPPIRFSHGETFIIFTLCEILKAMNTKSQEVDPKFVEAALLGGHLWGMRWKMSGIFQDHVDSEAVVSQVADTLTMWTAIEEGFEDLGADAKKRIKERFGTPKFEGYDANSEAEEYGIATFLIEDLGRFDRFEKRHLNAHGQLRDAYDRMLEVFGPMRSTLVGKGLGEAQITKILEARVHPSNRK